MPEDFARPSAESTRAKPMSGLGVIELATRKVRFRLPMTGTTVTSLPRHRQYRLIDPAKPRGLSRSERAAS